MRLASFEIGGQPGFGIVRGDEIVPVLPSAFPNVLCVKDLLSLTAVERAQLATGPVRFGIDEVRMLPPIPDPALIVGIGLNTRSHFEETAQRMGRVPGDYPKHPRLFIRTADSHVGHGEAIRVPHVSDRLDYEGEIAVIIGKGGRGIPAVDAISHIGGYACYNDGSVRDFQTHSNQVTAGKNFVASGAFGPWLVTADEVPDPIELTLETLVNGESRQRLASSDLIFGFADLIAYISIVFQLRPGDVIATGSPAGIGALDEKWLRPGDVVEVRIPAVGTLVNPVAAEC